MPVALARSIPTVETNPPCRVRARWRLPVAALALAAAALPAAGGPSAAGRSDSACWSTGTAPGLFDWTATPGIACRDGNGAAPPAVSAPQTATVSDGDPAPRTGTDQTQITFSGSAYVGIAVAF